MHGQNSSFLCDNFWVIYANFSVKFKIDQDKRYILIKVTLPANPKIATRMKNFMLSRIFLLNKRNYFNNFSNETTDFHWVFMRFNKPYLVQLQNN